MVAAGYSDRNLHARNVLLRPSGAGWEWFKIDSPRGGRSQSLVDDLAALDAFGRNVCTLRERWRVLVRSLGNKDRQSALLFARFVDAGSAAMQKREAPRLKEAEALSVA